MGTIALRYAFGAIATAALTAVAIAWYWRGAAIEARADVVTERAQVAILAADVKLRDDAALEFKRQADAARARAATEIAAARRQTADAERRAVVSAGKARADAPAGATSETAWTEIERSAP